MRHVVLAGLLLTLTSSAQAHIGGAEGVVPFLDDTGALVGAGTTWGLVFPGDDGDFGQTCEESIGDFPRAFLRTRGGARTIVSSGLGVSATVDLGCTWTAVDGTAGRSISALKPSATTSSTSWAVTATVAASDNAILVSTDDGEHYDIAHGVSANTFLTSLAVGVVAGADFLFIGGVDTETRAPFLATATATTAPAFLPVPGESQRATALAIDSDGDGDDGVFWFSTLDQIGRGHLWRASLIPDGDAAVVDTANAVEVGAFDGLVSAITVFGGFRYVLAAGGLLLRAPVDDLSTFTRQPQLPLRCLLHVDGDDGLWACGTQATGSWFLRTIDGETWAPVLPFADVADHGCPSTTPAAAACAYRFEVPTPPPDPETPPPTTPPPAPPPTSSSCGEGGSAAVIGLLVLRRRRRR